MAGSHWQSLKGNACVLLETVLQDPKNNKTHKSGLFHRTKSSLCTATPPLKNILRGGADVHMLGKEMERNLQ